MLEFRWEKFADKISPRETSRPSRDVTFGISARCQTADYQGFESKGTTAYLRFSEQALNALDRVHAVLRRTRFKPHPILSGNRQVVQRSTAKQVGAQGSNPRANLLDGTVMRRDKYGVRIRN